MGLPTQTCVTCLREPPPFERTVCAADYGFPWDRLIADFKFNGRVDLAPMCAERLVAAVNAAANAAVEAAGGDGSAVDLVVPIPLSPARMAERGYNQAWELARRVAEGLQRPARADLLLRPADTAHQATLSRQERQRNLAQAFMVDPRRRAAVQGLRMAVVDDVMTTGATAREAALALKRAGAREVHLWMLARTPD
jgi:ComF family protein